MSSPNMSSQKEAFFRRPFGFICLNLLIAVVLVIVLIAGTVAGMRQYTLHGTEVVIPRVVGLSETEAEMLLRGIDMHLVVIDSTFTTKTPLGTVVEQTPPADSHAKPGRPVYVVMNAHTKRLIPLPELHDVSYRQAEATLRSVGLQVGAVTYEPSLYPDNVLDIRDGEQSIEAGTRLPEGTPVTLVIGKRQGNRMVIVPALLGMSLSQARAALLQTGLTIGAYSYDEEPTPETLEQFIIYRQSPVEGATLQEGSTVNISLTTDLERAILSTDAQNDDNFF